MSPHSLSFGKHECKPCIIIMIDDSYVCFISDSIKFTTLIYVKLYFSCKENYSF